ncbi:MAG: MFS transporter [Pirellulales bacterium]
MLGIGQAGAYATTASYLRRWMPFSTRGFANSAVSLGGRAGGVLAPSLTSLGMSLVAFWGVSAGRWRPVFIGYGIVGLVWAWFFWRWFRDNPREHPSANPAEAALIEGPSAASVVERDDDKTDEKSVRNHFGELAPPTLSVRALVSHRGLQVLGVVSFAINVGWIFVGTLLPTYLINVHGQSEIEAGFATSLVAFAGMAGCLAGGFATDILVRRLGLAWGRRVPAMIAYGGAAVCYGFCYFLDDPRAIVTILVVASFMGDFGLGTIWCTFQDIGGVFAGTVLGAANMCGNFGAASASSFVPRLAEQFGWSASFALSAAAYTIGAFGWLLVDPRVPIAVSSSQTSSEATAR